ncbi:MAG TPA: Fe-S cluster assembly protein NifU [Spirochaetota bacterium]|nr:Fe-S cluster assembly protein NifU [Spirochaetota bacterium]HPI91307.1 Fe-S cluster assembly protein NifU [Spirochaetota bacterium]HPR48487.1 Fe-S cluster assembly protein NifU [Spirochaetota bacterium]
MWDYTDKVKELYKNPKNVGKIENADVVAEVGSIACGDALKLYLKVDDNDVITDAKFETFGCGSAIASSSALTEMIKGKTVDEAEKITNRDIADYLGGLPEEKMHCSVMGKEALNLAIAELRGEVEVQGYNDHDGEIICKCFGVEDTLIRKTIRENNLKTVEDVTNYTKAGGGCGSCIHKIEDILGEEREFAVVFREKEQEQAKSLTNIKRMQLVEETIADIIRPQLQKDGGDIELLDIDGKRVFVALRGSCSNCVLSDVTLRNLVQDRLREFVEEEIVVVEGK